MKNHKPLNWIKKTLIFLPTADKLAGKVVGPYLLDFQKDIITTALDSRGNPRKNIFLGYSRKISKSLIFSWIFNYFLENKKGFNLITMASTFGQSDIIFGLIRDQILLNPRINEDDYKIIREKINHLKNHNVLSKIYSKASSNLGLIGVNSLISDELGSQQSRDNLESIESGMSLSQTRPLLLYSTNPAERSTHWSNDFIKSLQKDKDFVCYDFSCPVKVDPFSQKGKRLANPFYDQYCKTKKSIFKPPYQYINKKSKIAKKHGGESEISYRRLQLGQRFNSQVYQWVSPEDIKIYKGDIKNLLKNPNIRAVLSFDLALSQDFCSCVLCLYDDSTEDIFLYPFLHLANLKPRRPAQQSQFSSWHNQKFITIQDRDSVSKDIFIQDIKSFLNKHKVSFVAHVWDRNLSTGWTDSFGGEPVKYRGTPAELTMAIRHIEARSKDGKLHFIGKNSCLAWMFENAVCSQKSKGYTLLDRTDWQYNIDGAVCATMGIKYFLDNPLPGFYGFAIE